MIYIVPIEPIPDRYPIHWFKYLPQFIGNHVECEQINIEMNIPSNDAGGFFNFNFTNKYKAAQLEFIADMIQQGKVKNGDVFFYTDYWNPTVHQLRYMLDINDLIDVKIVGFAHAGDWDPQDILHKKLVNKVWTEALELSLHYVYDEIYFSTNFAKELYRKNLVWDNDNKLIVTGFPMEYYNDVMPHENVDKEDIVVFPHRIADEKNVELFRLIAQRLPQYEFIIAQEVCKTKAEYHSLLYRSKVAFSAALQETGGISMGIEVLKAGCFPLVPDRLSYAEIFGGTVFTYPGNIANEVITDPSHLDIDLLVNYIDQQMKTFDSNREVISAMYQQNLTNFFSGDRLYSRLRNL